MRYDFFQFHIGQFSYRASYKGRLNVLILKLYARKAANVKELYHILKSLEVNLRHCEVKG